MHGVGADEGTAWRELSGNTETITVAGRPAAVLAVPARALYVTLHAAQHGKAWEKRSPHVERALRAVAESDWIEAASLADRLDATDAFATGLRLVPEGAALATHLSLPRTQSVKEVALHASTPPPIALGFEELASAASIRERLAILFRKVVPPPGFIRHWWPPAARNRRMLALGYAYRPLWLLHHAPRGLRAWLAARRKVRPER